MNSKQQTVAFDPVLQAELLGVRKNGCGLDECHVCHVGTHGQAERSRDRRPYVPRENAAVGSHVRLSAPMPE